MKSQHAIRGKQKNRDARSKFLKTKTQRSAATLDGMKRSSSTKGVVEKRVEGAALPSGNGATSESEKKITTLEPGEGSSVASTTGDMQSHPPFLWSVMQQHLSGHPVVVYISRGGSESIQATAMRVFRLLCSLRFRERICYPHTGDTVPTRRCANDKCVGSCEIVFDGTFNVCTGCGTAVFNNILPEHCRYEERREADSEVTAARQLADDVLRHRTTVSELGSLIVDRAFTSSDFSEVLFIMDDFVHDKRKHFSDSDMELLAASATLYHVYGLEKNDTFVSNSSETPSSSVEEFRVWKCMRGRCARMFRTRSESIRHDCSETLGDTMVALNRRKPGRGTSCKLHRGHHAAC